MLINCKIVTWDTPPEGYVKVTREEFNSFIQNYKSKLVGDWCGIGDVPVMSYNDFSSVYPDVAYYLDYNGDAYYKGRQTEYFIRRV